MAWVRVLALDELVEGQGTPLEVEGEEIALYRIGGTVFAVSNICSHAYAHLTDGEVEGYTVTCPAHGGQFDIRTGKALRLPAVSPIPTYPVKVEGGAVFVAIEES